MSIHESLLKIQTELKAPKGQTNTFGKYTYRSCEDILIAVKPLLKEYGLSLYIRDDLVNIGDRYYVKATVEIQDGENAVMTTAFAREQQTRKGMSEDQITGSCSSYARKYALNAMFLIDDTKDSDTKDNKEEEVETITEVQAKKVKSLIGETDSSIEKLLTFFKVKSVHDMTVPMFTKAVQMLNKKVTK